MSRLPPWVVLTLAYAVLAAICLVLYAPGLQGVLVFDSVERVARNDALRMESISLGAMLNAAYAGQTWYPQRGLAHITFALNYMLAGGELIPYWYKLTNVIIHVVNGLLVLVLARIIVLRWLADDLPGERRAPRLAVIAPLLAAGLWLLHPLQLTSVLYVVQRMTSLSALWVLAGLIVFAMGRARLERGAGYGLPIMVAGIGVGTLLGFLCKQNALLLPAFAGLVELFVFHGRQIEPSNKRRLAWFYGVMLVVPAVVALGVIVWSPDVLLDGYRYRDFGMYERLLTQSRVLFFYLGLMLVPDIRAFGLFHDDIAASTGLLDPVTTLLSVVAWLALLALLAWGAARRRPWAFALAWFLVGHSLESTVIALELVHEHRNYVPGVVPWIVVVYYAGRAWAKGSTVGRYALPALGAWLVVLGFLLHVRADYWRDRTTLMETLARNHPLSYRAAAGAAYNAVPPGADLAVRFEAFQRAAALNPRVVAPLVEMIKITEGLRVVLERMEAAPDEPSAAPGGLEIGSMELAPALGHTLRLQGALAAAIDERLAGFPVRTDSVVALVAVVDCVLSGTDPCAGLGAQVLQWHVTALANRGTAPDYRAVLELSVAKIHVAAGDHEAAVEHAGRAGRLAGDNLNYRAQEASLYALLGRWREVARVLAEVEEHAPGRAGAEPDLRRLRERLEKHERGGG